MSEQEHPPENKKEVRQNKVASRAPKHKKDKPSLVAILRELLTEKVQAKDVLGADGVKKYYTVQHLIAVKLMTKALKGDIRAIVEVFDRIDGKVVQSSSNVNLTYEDIKSMSDEELHEYREKLSGGLPN